MKELIEKKPKFDVAIVSPFCLDTGLYLAKEYFDSPIIGFFFGKKILFYCM